MHNNTKFGFWKCIKCGRLMRNVGFAKVSHLKAHVKAGEMTERELENWRMINLIRRG